jgi:L-threonylcarbamoyladenylate synthase
LANAYWPGPLTIVVKANLKLIPELITAGTGFVGLRMPNNEIALNLLKTSGLPIAAPSANKFGHVSPSKAQHVYNDFHLDCEVAILDGGSCSFGIESTVLKVGQLAEVGPTHFDLTILRKGGVSEKSLHETVLASEDLKDYQINVTSKKHKDFKKETEKLEGPGQFLRHYAPNIDSFLFSGKLNEQEGAQLQLNSSVIIDFSGIHSSLRNEAMHYIDLSPAGSTTEAISNIYDALRWAETREDAKAVLITDLILF